MNRPEWRRPVRVHNAIKAAVLLGYVCICRFIMHMSFVATAVCAVLVLAVSLALALVACRRLARAERNTQKGRRQK